MQPIKIYNDPQVEVTIGDNNTVINVIEGGTPIELTVGGTFVSWGDISGNIADQTDLQTILDSKVDENSPITGATKTKITYDSKGLVTSGADAGIADITGLQTALDSKVNKSGDTMTGDLNFTGHGVNSTDYVVFNTSYTDGIVEGRLQWNATDGHLEVGLAGSDILGDTTPGMVRVVNKTGSPILRGKVVYINGGQGNRPTITLASNASEGTSSKTFGVTAEEIGDNQPGWVLKFGFLYNVNTNGYTAGQTVYLSTSGNITGTKPSAPNHMVAVGKVINVSATVGTLYIEIQNGFELEELHNVSAASPSNNDGIFFNSSTSLWEKKSISTVLGYSPGTVTQVNASAGTGISISGSPITTSGTITVTNTAPDQVVSLSSGTGISTSGTYPSFTITNSAPDQTVSLTGSGTVSISGTYPNFTITGSSSGISDGDKGDITVSSSGSVWTIDNQAVTYAKIQNVTDNKLLGRSAGSAGSVQEITIGSGISLSGGTLTASSSSYSIATKTTTYTETATSGEIVLLADTTSGAFTINLATAVSNTSKVTIKKIAGSATLTVDANGSQTIDGGLTASIVRIYESITLVSDNANWHII
jgi:hypothetical protein